MWERTDQHNRNKPQKFARFTDNSAAMARFTVRRLIWAVGGLIFGLLTIGCVPGTGPWSQVCPEQRHLEIREPSQLPHAQIPVLPEPETVARPFTDVTPQELSLDQAIRIALANSKVVRILAGTTAVSSGQTIYDPAIANTFIDDARSVFDPVIGARNAFSRSEVPAAFFDANSPLGAIIAGDRIDNYDLGLGVTKRTITGGTLGFNVDDNVARFHLGPAPLNPQQRGAVTLSYTQPLLQGAGVDVNLAPIVIARINTERSFFQFKDAMQQLVRDTIEAYWAVVFARTDVWARRQQVEQGEVANARAEARQRQGLGNAAEVAQTRVALTNFRANLITAKANLLNREAALRNLLGLPPTEPMRFVPITPPTPERYEPKWEQLLALAEERRPDLIELKLIIEADQQNLIIAQNNALPRVDASMLYRWNGLEGTTPSGVRLSSDTGQFADWSLGVNFSVPLGLRQGRADLRRSELILARDRANLDQGLHFAIFSLAGGVRNIDQYYSQYQAYRETRIAARINLEQQAAEFRAGRAIFLNVLQAITDWGNAVSSEAQALAQYNVELATLERLTGTILETHGVAFVEERFRSIGPLGRCGPTKCYPKATPAGPNADRYPTEQEPSDAALERDKPKVPTLSGSEIPLLPPPTPERPPKPK